MPRKNKYLTGKDIVKNVAKRSKLDRELVEKVFSMYIEEIKTGITSDKRVKLHDFGTFELTEWKSTEIFDVNTRQKVAKNIKTVSFKASPKIKGKIAS